MELRGVFELEVLGGIRRLRRAHFLPCGVGVAVRSVDAKVFDVDARNAGGKTAKEKIDLNGCGGEIVVVIIPDKNSECIFAARGDDIYVRGISNARLKNVGDLETGGTGGVDAFLVHET